MTVSMTAIRTSYMRPSKKSVGVHPVPCPKAAIKDKKDIVVKRKGKIIKRLSWTK